ncbi:MAG: tetratricopeptide repeat protein [Candidatus Sulfotelmatobacter sp.]
MMMQALTPPASFFFVRDFSGRESSQRSFKMFFSRWKAFFFLSLAGCFWSASIAWCQQPKAGAAPHAALTPEKALALANQGLCRESISALKRALTSQLGPATKKEIAVVGVRCSLAIDDRDSTLDFIRFLHKQFPLDPDVLFVVTHAYSDLSTSTAQDLGRTAPQSFAAHKLNAEALEMQGKWEPAQLEYEGMIKADPGARGIHFLLGRLLLSRPDAGPDAPERAKQEFLRELQIDPSNAGAEYILGELARQDEKWDEAISRFSQAAKLNPNFADAYLGWGLCLVTVKKYEDAIGPLRTAERLAPGNPEVHHTLATALERSGHKEEAEKEFAIHRSLNSAETERQQ